MKLINLNPKMTTNCTITNSTLIAVKFLTVYIDIETLGLNAYEQRITCIGVLVDDDKSSFYTKIFNDAREAELLQRFLKFYNGLIRISETVTWNGKSFDLPYLQVRCLRYSMKFRVSNPVDAKLLLPEFEFNGKWRRPSLSEAADFLGIGLGKKSKFDGKDAITLAKLGMRKDLGEYCANDVRLLRSIYRVLRA